MRTSLGLGRSAARCVAPARSWTDLALLIAFPFPLSLHLCGHVEHITDATLQAQSREIACKRIGKLLPLYDYREENSLPLVH